MDSKDDNKKKESANSAETKKQNEDFRDIPASSEKQNPSDVDKEDVQKSSKNNQSGKTDNIK
ncbi:hypothetical protein [Chryseobacterium indoltheticum]|jgi:hypothetical protein|uniref:Uncharacterized protein n=1 Tax=Chryseobacterium indoltheticum TaxID=254 RepID=A0A381FFS4_9FLAO|nr:hypothetical protein [Chryseobacterium indoltheticum]AZA59887.1 hypothetical protein EG340_01980 [Chryseobacterium indoltheticum]AZA74443.1 hypothetical protein EG358_12045 [Chryseobacterium indoltheticum]MDF2834298.1 hypothetical protein [Chryseobacterium indoltheticum]SIQ05608.1 hypothetical protein SAMN05421682_102182 [Chryseobacterium indoltheticum]SUX43658.1 Uncharacterised protein [Chryseobacterium indoltheticum]